MVGACPICGSARLAPSVRTPRLEVVRCRVCGHRIATHLAEARANLDYHDQYDQGGFLTSLASTRQRQAAVIINMIRGRLRDTDAILDFGAGRGWFLEACRAAGFRSLAGADTSELAVRSLAERQFAAITLSPASSDYSAALGQLPFRPRILTMLDVVEHFPPDQLKDVLGNVLQGLRSELELVVIKVPDAGGLFHRGASLLARAGIAGPIEQLYQVGTHPPHFSYFTHGSMGRLLEGLGLRVLEVRGDRDFEPVSLGQRARALARMPAIGRIGGSTAARVADLTRWHDAAIYLATSQSRLS
jgi:hypothetical protein